MQLSDTWEELEPRRCATLRSSVELRQREDGGCAPFRGCHRQVQPTGHLIALKAEGLRSGCSQRWSLLLAVPENLLLALSLASGALGLPELADGTLPVHQYLHSVFPLLTPLWVQISIFMRAGHIGLGLTPGAAF